MDTYFGEEIVSIHSDSQILESSRTGNILPPDGDGNPIQNTEFFNADDIDDVMSSDNSLMQTIESSYFTHSGTQNNNINNMTRTVMESMPYADGLKYSATISSFSDNFKEMDQRLQIKQQHVDPSDLYESSDEEVYQMSKEEIKKYFNVQEEVVVQECPEQEVITSSWDINRSADIDTLLNAEVKCLTSPVDVDIPIPEGEVNPYPCDFCSRRFKRKSHLVNHMVIHQSERPFCCALCDVRYRRKCDLANHMKIHIGLANVSDNTDIQSTSVSKVMNKLMFIDPIHKRSVTPGEESEDKGDTYPEHNLKNGGHGRGRGSGRRRGRPKKDRLLSLGWNSELCSKPHTCNPCGISFTREKAFLNHARRHHVDDSTNIIATQKVNSDSYELTILANTKSEDVSYHCNSCDAVFDRFDFFKRHQRQHMKTELGNVEEEVYEESHMCIHCRLFFKSMLELEVHTEQHLFPTNIPEISKCLICGETFDSTDELSDHISQMHDDSLSEYSCKFCRKQCKNDKALHKHLMVHDTSDNKCLMCSKRLSSRARLKRHMITHREKKIICDICGEEVPDNRSFFNHRASHTNTVGDSKNCLTEKIFPCSSCGKVFGSRSSQQIHIRIHTGERPFGCKYCDKTFVDGGTLRKHERIHTGEKPYACPVCPKAFNQRVVLREHIRAYHAGTRGRGGHFFECKVCGYLFRSSTELYSHLVQHSDENTAKSRVVPVIRRKYKRRSKLGNCKDTWCLAEKITVMSGQSDTESCEDEPMPTVDEQAVQSVTDEEDFPYSPTTMASPKSLIKTYKTVHGKLDKNKQKSSKQVPYVSHYAVPNSEPMPKKQSFVLKEGECTRTCSTVLYYSLRLDPTAIDSSFGEESKENDNPDEPEDMISVKDMNNANSKIVDDLEFTAHDFENICSNIEYANQGEVEYFIQNNDEFDVQEDILKNVNDDWAIETELLFNTDYEEVGANIELNTEEMVPPVFTESISCDLCDEIFEDRKELMKHIRTMHIG